MGKAPFQKFAKISIPRKVAIGAWSDRIDPSVYSRIELDISNVLVYS
jgi:hypothetical protein